MSGATTAPTPLNLSIAPFHRKRLLPLLKLNYYNGAVVSWHRTEAEIFELIFRQIFLDLIPGKDFRNNLLKVEKRMGEKK